MRNRAWHLFRYPLSIFINCTSVYDTVQNIMTYKTADDKDIEIHPDFTIGNIVLYGDDNVGFKVHDYYLKARR